MGELNKNGNMSAEEIYFYLLTTIHEAISKKKLDEVDNKDNKIMDSLIEFMHNNYDLEIIHNNFEILFGINSNKLFGGSSDRPMNESSIKETEEFFQNFKQDIFNELQRVSKKLNEK